MTLKILVTGGAGYIGSHCCKLLAKQGYAPIVYDNLSTGHRGFVQWGKLVEGDIRDKARLEAVLAAEQPVAVMHFAALALVGESVCHPERYWSVNGAGTYALLEAMRKTDCNNLIFSSTCAIYGKPDKLPIDEGAPKVPINPYGASKLTAEMMMESFDRAHGLRSVRLRYFNAAGADPDCDVGEDHESETHLIPLILDVALGRRPEISVFGNDYPTPDGTAIRDYVHVLDIAEAHIAALDHLIAGGETIALNLGTGRGASVSEVVAAVESVTGCLINKVHVPRRPGDPHELWADPMLAEEKLKWRAQKPLEIAVEDAWRWHQMRFGKEVCKEGGGRRM
ncbi:UDP-glucose 4-epimerase GalE [Limibaculum sp. FT325]|uniref:UDP-glucose 4-epimerase GalE n=1 Tax=Thermohalobaculum sediminis TaxID=2939436 RepID=UPI0020BEFF58|nr:UDP-glucose 4-epimerase GalE [Limibaculum sediminis]MCL5776871.1 UDP-glucose 4-epimerase GalE [Limibaculum sediminis]